MLRSYSVYQCVRLYSEQHGNVVLEIHSLNVLMVELIPRLLLYMQGNSVPSQVLV